MKAAITIITPADTNDPKIVKRCIDCVKRQTFQDWYHVICSDGAPDHVVSDLVNHEKDPRIEYKYTEKKYDDLGASVRQQVMDKWVDSEFLMFLNLDNIIFPKYLDKMIQALGEAKHFEQFAICEIMHFGPLMDFVGNPPFLLVGEPKLYFIDTMQVVVTTEAMKTIGWQNKGYCSDGYTFEELGRKYKYVRVSECLGIHM
jgi:glycosyltransferase involved in cell wall biosynthesis